MKISYIIRRFNGRQVITEPGFQWSYPTQEDAIEAIEEFCEKNECRTTNEFLIWTLATYEKPQPKVKAPPEDDPIDYPDFTERQLVELLYVSKHIGKPGDVQSAYKWWVEQFRDEKMILLDGVVSYWEGEQ